MKHIPLLVLLFTFSACKKWTGPLFNDLQPEKLQLQVSNIPNGNYGDFMFVDVNTGFAVAEGFMARTFDGGVSWDRIALPEELPGLSVHFPNLQTGYIIAGQEDRTTLFKSTDGGNTWITIEGEFFKGATKVMFLDSDRGFVVGNNVFLGTIDGGATWTEKKPTTAFRVLNDIQFKNSSTGYATALQGKYYTTVDGGASWVERQHQYDGNLHEILITEDEIYAFNRGGILADLNNTNVTMPADSRLTRLIMFSRKHAMGIGVTNEGDWLTPSIISVTNNAWLTKESRYLTDIDIEVTVSSRHTILRKISDDRAMMIGNTSEGTKIYSYLW